MYRVPIKAGGKDSVSKVKGIARFLIAKLEADNHAGFPVRFGEFYPSALSAIIGLKLSDNEHNLTSI